MKTTCSGVVAVLVSLFLITVGSQMSSADAAEEVPSFSRDVLPILSDKCFVCHGPDAAEIDANMLRLDDAALAMADRGGHRAINVEHPEQSRLLHRIQSIDDPMPPADAEKQLTDRERDILVQWIRSGGSYAKHWAFEKPQKKLPEAVRIPAASATTAIDAWIKAGFEPKGINFAPEADPVTLVRRLSLILTGLPPEPSQVERFLNDKRPDALEHVVDEMLASPHFGEHQARYWLDAVRYGDTHGLHLDNRRGIYPYRDWVVRAFNRNMPLDRFLVWQLAGDLLPNPGLEQKVATGFVRMNPTTAEGGAIPEEFQAKNNFDRTETLGTVLLGMSFVCARCHTHKYDPITQTDYYQLLAFFNSTAEHSMDGNKYEYGPTEKVPPDQVSWQRWDQLNQQKQALLTTAADFVKQSASAAPDLFSTWNAADAVQQFEMLTEGRREFAGTELSQQANILKQQLEKEAAGFTTTLVAQDLPLPRETRLLRRGEYNLPTGDPLTPGVPAVMGELPPGAPRNRLGLAMWLTSREHPLVGRVLVNRIWQQVFGYGLVRTPEDFGLQGQQPTHPELLDWLAVELHDSRWNLKQMIRAMVLSQTFRQSSAIRSDIDDPENRLFARVSSYRLDAEVLRDIGLWSSGLLNPHMGGEGIKPYQPSGMWAAMAHPASNTKLYERDQGQRLYQRSLYVYWKRTSPHPMMTLFDAPDRESSCVRRSRTNTSLQSLGLLNETQRIEMARALAERLLLEAEHDDQRLNRLFLLLASRPPNDTERSVCIELLTTMKQQFSERPEDATALVSIGDAPRKTQINDADVAAWTQLTVTVLASDAAIMLY